LIFLLLPIDSILRLYIYPLYDDEFYLRDAVCVSGTFEGGVGWGQLVFSYYVMLFIVRLFTLLFSLSVFVRVGGV
jgi:hypothetical protein